jgi:hypothetical protein
MALSIMFVHPLLAVLGLLIGSILFIVLKSRNAGLEHIPGPFIAKYTNAWRAYKAWKSLGVNKAFLNEAVQDYGDVVRVGPKTVAVMDPEAIPSVLGQKARLDKVSMICPNALKIGQALKDLGPCI